MTSGQVTVSTGGQSNAANLFTEYMQSLTQVKNNVMDQINGIHWTGDARTIFNQALEQWNTEFTSIMNDLQAMSELMGTTAKNYGTTARNTESSASQLKNATANLPGF